MIIFGPKTTAADGWKRQEARLGDLTIHLSMSPKAPSQSAEFLPNSVMKGDQVLWQFDPSYIGCLTFLREADGEYLIVYATRREVVDIVPILDLPDTIRLAGGQYDWKRPSIERLSLKVAAAEVLGLKLRLSPAESTLKKVVDARRAEQARAAAAVLSAAAAAERQQAHIARAAAREERKRAIRLRPFLTVWTASGERKHGVPVVDDEWRILGNGVNCVAVKSYADGEVGEPIAAFFVKEKSGNKKFRAGVTTVFAEDPTKPKLTEKMGEIVVEVGGNPDVVSCYTRDGLAALKAEGLNSGAVRAVWPINNDGSYTLVSFAKGDLQDIGNFMPMN